MFTSQKIIDINDCLNHFIGEYLTLSFNKLNCTKQLINQFLVSYEIFN